MAGRNGPKSAEAQHSATKGPRTPFTRCKRRTGGAETAGPRKGAALQLREPNAMHRMSCNVCGYCQEASDNLFEPAIHWVCPICEENEGVAEGRSTPQAQGRVLEAPCGGVPPIRYHSPQRKFLKSPTRHRLHTTRPRFPKQPLSQSTRPFGGSTDPNRPTKPRPWEKPTKRQPFLFQAGG